VITQALGTGWTLTFRDEAQALANASATQSSGACRSLVAANTARRQSSLVSA
jgi:hypothetical protein